MEEKMNWIDEVSLKLKKKNQVLFSKSSEYMQDLIKLFEIQNHRVMALWAFDLRLNLLQNLKKNIQKKNVQEKLWKKPKIGHLEKSKCT